MLKSNDMRVAAELLRNSTASDDVAMRIARDLEDAANRCEGHPTIESYHADMALSNDRATYELQRRIAVRAAARKPADTEDVGAMDALRDWCREVAHVTLDGARYRITREVPGPAQDDRTGTAPESREIAEGYEMFTLQMARLAIDGIDFLKMARDVLGDENDRENYRGHVAVLRALYELYPNSEEPAGEVPLYAIQAKCAEAWGQEDNELVADLLRELGKFKLVGDRYVGGVSRYLYAPTEEVTHA